MHKTLLINTLGCAFSALLSVACVTSANAQMFPSEKDTGPAGLAMIICESVLAIAQGNSTMCEGSYRWARLVCATDHEDHNSPEYQACVEQADADREMCYTLTVDPYLKLLQRLGCIET